MSPMEARPELQNLSQFGCKGAPGRLLPVFAAATPLAVRTLHTDAIRRSRLRHGCCLLRTTYVLALRGLGGVGAQKPVFERGAVKAADDRLHLIGSRRFDKCETLRFLRFVIADYLDGIGHQIFGGEPLLNVIGGYPRREIAKKNSKTHSVDYLTPLVGLVLQRKDSDVSKPIVSETSMRLQINYSRDLANRFSAKEIAHISNPAAITSTAGIGSGAAAKSSWFTSATL